MVKSFYARFIGCLIWMCVLKQNEDASFALLQQVDNLGILTNASPHLRFIEYIIIQCVS